MHDRKIPWIGLTGPLGAGKSFVAAVWKEMGAGVVEGDVMGRLALESDLDLRRKLSARFGSEILRGDGSIKRSVLASRAFADARGRSDLTSLTFPVLYRIALEHLEHQSKSGTMVVFDAALIFEWGVESDFDRIVTVSASHDLLIGRVMARLGISQSQAEDRLAAQLPPEEKVRRADIVIDNDADLESLKRKSQTVWKLICEEFGIA